MKKFEKVAFRALALGVFPETSVRLNTVGTDTRRVDRNRNTRGNVSKISVDKSMKGFPTTFRASDHESELAINKFYSAVKTPYGRGRHLRFIIMDLFKAYARSATTDIDKCAKHS